MDFLVQVDENEVVMARLLGKKWVILKVGETIYRVKPGHVADFPKLLFGEHKCATCQNLSGVRCQKVFDMGPEYYRAQTGEYGAVVDSKRIEKYPFILSGVEKFNCGQRSYFVVSKCNNYQPDSAKPKKVVNPARIDQTKVELAQFLWPDVKTITEVQERSMEARGEGPRRAY